MSTRCSVHFCSPEGETEAIVYRHSDGYPECAGKDLVNFLVELQENVADHRFTDATMLAARYVHWLAHQFSKSSNTHRLAGKAPHFLNHLSVRVELRDSCDIEYRYRVITQPQ